MSRVILVFVAAAALALSVEAFSAGSAVHATLAGKIIPSTASARPLRRQSLGLRMADLYEDDQDPVAARE